MPGIQELQRKEWSFFKGLHSDVIGSIIPTNYAQTAENCLLENGVLELALGDSQITDAIGASTSANHQFVIVLRDEDFSALSADEILIHTGTNWKNGVNSIGHTTGTASFTNGSATVTGSGTTWTTHLKAGDFIKNQAAADTAYQEISTVDSNTQVTLTSNWAGSTVSGVSYRARITWTGSDNNLVDAKVFNGFCVMTNRSNIVASYNGTTMDVIDDSTVPKAGFLEVHKRRLFAANTTGNPDSIYWSPINAPTSAWNASATAAIYPLDGGGGIAGIKSFKNRLFVFKRFNSNVYEIRGEFDTTIGTFDSIVKVNVPYDIGVVLSKTIIEWKGFLYFLTSKGLFIFDGQNILKATNGLDNHVNNNESDYVSDSTRQRSFATVFDEKLFINLADNGFCVIDGNDNITLQTHPTSNAYGGHFGIRKASNTIQLVGLNTAKIVRIWTGYTRTDDTDDSNDAYTLTYTTGDDYLETPEYEKTFYKFFVVFEETTASSSFTFSYDINNTGSFYTASTITSTGTSGRIRVAEIRVHPQNITDRNIIGRCIKWRLQNSSGINVRIIKVVLRYEILGLR